MIIIKYNAFCCKLLPNANVFLTIKKNRKIKMVRNELPGPCNARSGQ